jgi:Zn-dependent protease with chaperone function
VNVAPALVGYAVAIGFLAPQVLVRSSWPHRAPALAAAAWHALAVSFSISVALAAFHLAVPTEHLHAGLVGFLHSCGLTPVNSAADPDTADRLAIALPVSVGLLLLGTFAFEVLRARRHRSRHLQVLNLVGRRSDRLRATVLEHALPAAYCLPGRYPRIVVSQGAIRLLSSKQLNAVLEHERAHIAGRHHLVLAVAEAFAKVFRWVPLARHARAQTALLLEMIADDRALAAPSAGHGGTATSPGAVGRTGSRTWRGRTAAAEGHGGRRELIRGREPRRAPWDQGRGQPLR